MGDGMLLGLDFLYIYQQKTIIDLNEGKLDIDQERITMNTCSDGSCNELLQISNVIINNNAIIPPCFQCNYHAIFKYMYDIGQLRF